jgi:hypothetical protein
MRNKKKWFLLHGNCFWSDKHSHLVVLGT